MSQTPFKVFLNMTKGIKKRLTFSAYFYIFIVGLFV